MPEMTDAVAGKERLKEYFNTVTAADNISSGKGRAQLDDILDWYRDPTTQYASSLMGDMRGKAVLELGCGIGAYAIDLARRGASVTAVDIAEERIAIARDLVRECGCEDRVTFLAADIFDAKLPAGAFDYIYGHDILMYLKRDDALMKELGRILKRGGKAVFIEALRDHPIAFVYRKLLAPKTWSQFTDYFKVADLEIFRKNFAGIEHKEFYLTGFLAYFWKTHLQSKGLFRFFERILYALDGCILKVFPFLRRYCWRIVFAAEKG